MADFNISYGKLADLEGGYSDRPSDPGGPTNYGISLRFLRNVGDDNGDGFLDGDLDSDGDVDRDDIKAIDPHHAKEIYRQEFWLRYGYDCIESQAVADKVLQVSVHAGPGRAARVLQEAIATNHAIVVDGILGPKTLKRANNLPETWLVTEVKHQTGRFYRTLLGRRPQMEEYRRGFLNRAYSD